MESTRDIQTFIAGFNEAWIKGNFSDLKEMLHPDVVFVASEGRQRLIGREKCLASLKEYVSIARTHSFKIEDQQFNLWDHQCIAELKYEVIYEISNEIFNEEGWEIWSLICLENKWKLVWRALIYNKPIRS